MVDGDRAAAVQQVRGRLPDDRGGGSKTLHEGEGVCGLKHAVPFPSQGSPSSGAPATVAEHGLLPPREHGPSLRPPAEDVPPLDVPRTVSALPSGRARAGSPLPPRTWPRQRTATVRPRAAAPGSAPEARRQRHAARPDDAHRTPVQPRGSSTRVSLVLYEKYNKITRFRPIVY